MKKLLFIKIGILSVITICFGKISSEVEYASPPPEWAFQLIEYGDPFDPLCYSPYEDIIHPQLNCSGTGHICIIEVYEDEIYAPTDIQIPSYWGKPKVDSGVLLDNITTALAALNDPYITGTGRFIWKKF